MDATISERVRAALATQNLTQRQVAERVGMTPDALSRALNGQRGFGSVELARLADLIQIDMYYLVTGRSDPNALKIAARHVYDRGVRDYSNETRDGDDAVLANIRLAYVQAYPKDEVPRTALPDSAVGVRRALGEDYVRHFSQRLEEQLGVDVVRLGELGTDYSFLVHQKPVIALKATANWFRENWSLAHELGHLVLEHHGASASTGDMENAANAFAADLLLPREMLTAVNWDVLTVAEVGKLVWDWGVSTEALNVRLRALRLPVPDRVASALARSTPDLVRNYALDATQWRQVVDRQRHASARRFPAALTFEHEQAVACGRLGKGILAWMLGVSPQTLEVEEPPTPTSEAVTDLAAALGLGAS